MFAKPASTVKPVDICSGSCTWVFSGGGWTVQTDDCKAGGGCACSSDTEFAAGTKFKSRGIPEDPIEHKDFVAAVERMLKNPTLPKGFTAPKPMLKGKPVDPLDASKLPSNDTTYEMPCVK